MREKKDESRERKSKVGVGAVLLFSFLLDIVRQAQGTPGGLQRADGVGDFCGV